MLPDPEVLIADLRRLFAQDVQSAALYMQQEGTHVPRPKRNKGYTPPESMPSLEVILSTWLTPKQVAVMKDISESNVRYLCQQETIKSKNIAGRWYIEPDSAAEYQVSGRAQKYKDSNE